MDPTRLVDPASEPAIDGLTAGNQLVDPSCVPSSWVQSNILRCFFEFEAVWDAFAMV